MSIGELRPSIAISYNNEIYTIISHEHVKLGRGSAFCRVKLRNLRTAQVIDCTLRNSDNIERAFIEKRKLQYLYSDENHYHFLDLETYEGLILHESRIAEKANCLKDNLEVIGLFYDKTLLDLELPSSIILKVIETTPGYKGDTVKMGTKPAKLETGLIVNVPLFINTGDEIKVDTQTKEYLKRA